MIEFGEFFEGFHWRSRAHAGAEAAEREITGQLESAELRNGRWRLKVRFIDRVIELESRTLELGLWLALGKYLGFDSAAA